MIVEMYLELCLLMLIMVFDCEGLIPEVRVLLLTLIVASAVTMIVARKMGIVPTV